MIAIVVLLIMTVFSLRHNNQTMISLRQAVYTADEQGGDVEGALQDLRQYVYAHMNTNLASGDNPVYPPIQLKHTYDRLVVAQKQQGAQQSEAIYTEAQQYCEKLHPESFSGGPRVPCIQQYITEHSDSAAETPTIPDSLYKFDFASPRWSPDLAGWSIVLTCVAIIALLLRIAIPFVLRQLRVL